MIKFKAESGHLAYRSNAAETLLLGGMGICDDCGELAVEGFLVPVLNHYMCSDCFNDWERRGTFYPEDIPIERRTAAYFESRIPLEGDETQ